MSLNESIVEDAALEWFLLRSAPLNFGGLVGDQPLLAAISAALRFPRGEGVIRRGGAGGALAGGHPVAEVGRSSIPHPRHLARDAAAEAAERGIGRGGAENQWLRKPRPLISFL